MGPQQPEESSGSGNFGSDSFVSWAQIDPSPENLKNYTLVVRIRHCFETDRGRVVRLGESIKDGFRRLG